MLWLPESFENLRAYHCIDAEKELVEAISLEIALEIDKEITDNLHVKYPEDIDEARSFAGTDKFLARIKEDPPLFRPPLQIGSVGYRPRTVAPPDGPPTKKPMSKNEFLAKAKEIETEIDRDLDVIHNGPKEDSK